MWWVNIICGIYPLELWKYATEYAIKGVIAPTRKFDGYAADNIQIRGYYAISKLEVYSADYIQTSGLFWWQYANRRWQ